MVPAVKNYSYQALARGFLFPEASSIATRELIKLDRFIERYGRFKRPEFNISMIILYFLERDTKQINHDLKLIHSAILIDMIDDMERDGLRRLSVLNRLHERRRAIIKNARNRE